MLLTVLVGCADAPRPRMDRAAVLPPPSADTMAGNDAQKSFEAPPPPRIPPTIRIGTGQTINAEAAAAPPPGSGAGGPGETTFNFEGESLNAVVKAILGDLLQKNYVIAPGVQGTVTLSTPSPVNANQALSLLEMVLGWNNARMFWANGRYNIVPSDQAVPGNLAPHTGSAAGARGYEVRAVPLHFISATEMQKLLVPYARPNAIVSVDPARNLLVLAGTRDELNNYLRTVQIFDVDWLAGMSVGVFPLQQTDAAHIVTQLEQAFGEHSKTPVAGMFRFMPLEGINAVLVITPQPKYLNDMQTWIDRLDQGDGQTPRLYVYDVKNVKATDLSTQLGTLYGNSAPQQVSSPSTMPGLDPVEVSTYDQDRQGAAPTPAPVAQSSRNGAASAAAASQGQASGVSITAVEDSNSLLVRATPLQWESIRRAIDRLDAMPLQVHIEAQVIEVKLTGDLSYGVSWYFQNAIPDPTLRGIAAGKHGFGPIAGSILPFTDPVSPGASWTFLGHNSLAVIKALDAVTNVRVLSAPSLVVRNNVEADFDSGTQIPVASTIFNPASGTTPSPTPGDGSTVNTYSQVQFRQTGVSLKVKPRVSTNGMVFMDITQDVSSPSSTGPTIAGNISVDNRKLKTSVAVPSGETVVLAGLIKQTDGVGRNGVPYLSRIPVIGGLFGTQSKNKEREEVLVLITPTVIRDPADLRKLTDEYGSRFQALDPLRQPPKGK
ncbi:MAG: type II secretion system secretin GspD [Lysobacteraceae bacterium]